MSAILDKVKSLMGKSPKTPQFGRLAEEMRLNGHAQKAIQFCQEGLKHRPGYATGHYVLARCYIDENQISKARESLVEALRFGPHHVAVITELAALYHNEGNENQALYYYRQAQAIDPLNRRVRNLVDTLEEKTGEPIDATELEVAYEKTTFPPPVKIESDERLPSQEDITESSEEIESEESVTEESEPIADLELVPPSSPVDPVPTIEPEPVATSTPPPESGPVFATGPWIAEIFQDLLPASEQSSDAASRGLASEDFKVNIYENMLALTSPGQLVEEISEIAQEETADALFDEPELPEPVSEDDPVSYDEPEEQVEEISPSEETEVSDESKEDKLIVPPGYWEENRTWDSESIKEPDETIEEIPISPEVEEEPDTLTLDESHEIDGEELIVSDDLPNAPMPIVPVNYLDQFFIGQLVNIQADQEIKSPENPLVDENASEPTNDSGSQEIDNNPLTGDTSISEAIGTDISLDTTVAEDSHHEESAVQEEELAPPPAETDSDGDVEDDPQADAIPTATLAELYVRQGVTDRAISIYLAMIENDPAKPEIKKRLSELFVLKAEQDGP